MGPDVHGYIIAAIVGLSFEHTHNARWWWSSGPRAYRLPYTLMFRVRIPLKSAVFFCKSFEINRKEAEDGLLEKCLSILLVALGRVK